MLEMKTITAIAFSALCMTGCTSARHLRNIPDLQVVPNPLYRMKFVAHMQTRLSELPQPGGTDMQDDAYRNLEHSYLTCISLGTNGWFYVASRSHHADTYLHNNPERGFGSISVALDSEGYYFFSMRDICGRPTFRNQPYASRQDFFDKCPWWNWKPLPRPNTE